MGVIVGLSACLVVASLFVVSLKILKILFEKKNLPGVVEQRLDLALEVELIADAIERYANNEYRR